MENEITFDTDITKITVSDKTIYENITRVYGESFIMNIKPFLNFVAEWISRNSEALGSKNIGKRISFFDTDEARLFDIFHVDKAFIREVIKHSTHIQKTWAISVKPLNVLMYVLIFYYYDQDKKFQNLGITNIEPYKIANILLCARFFSSLIIRQFKYEPDDAIMFYTMENLSAKFTITKVNSLYELVQYLADSNIENWIESGKIKSRTDKDLDSYMRKLNTRISSSLVNISKEFYENHKKDKKIINESNTIEYEDGKTDLNVTTNVSNDLAIITRKIFTNLQIDSSIDIKMLRLACKKANVPYSSMYKVLQEIQKNEEDKMFQLIENILAYFLVSEKMSIDQIHSFKFFEVCIKAYRVSNTKDPYILKIKEVLNDLLMKYSDLYAKSNRANTKANLRSALYLYLIFVIARLS